MGVLIRMDSAAADIERRAINARIRAEVSARTDGERAGYADRLLGRYSDLQRGECAPSDYARDYRAGYISGQRTAGERQRTD